MKLPVTLPLLVGLACPFALSADESEVNLPRQVQVQVEFVELGHKDLTKLLFLSKPEVADATPLRETVAEMVKKGEANVLETMMVVAQSGKKASSGSIREFIYPTEYERPRLPTPGHFPLPPEDVLRNRLRIPPHTHGLRNPESWKHAGDCSDP